MSKVPVSVLSFHDEKFVSEYSSAALQFVVTVCVDDEEQEIPVMLELSATQARLLGSQLMATAESWFNTYRRYEERYLIHNDDSKKEVLEWLRSEGWSDFDANTKAWLLSRIIHFNWSPGLDNRIVIGDYDKFRELLEVIPDHHAVWDYFVLED